MALGTTSLPAQAPVTLAVVNARVWTGARTPRTDAIGIKGNRIAALGAGAVRAASGRATQVIDLKGAFVMPGFIDNHTHFLRGSAMLSQPSLRDAATPQEFARRIGEAAAKLPKGKWLEGGHWDEQLWGGELPRREWIDALTPDTPVAVARLDLHMYLCNAVALKLAGITRDLVSLFSRCSWFPVISLTDAGTWSPPSALESGRKFGARFVVTGTLGPDAMIPEPGSWLLAGIAMGISVVVWIFSLRGAARPGAQFAGDGGAVRGAARRRQSGAEDVGGASGKVWGLAGRGADPRQGRGGSGAG